MSPTPYKKLRKQDKPVVLHPCPLCGKPDKLPAWKRALGQKCDECPKPSSAKDFGVGPNTNEAN